MHYSRSNSTKSPGSGVGNVSEPRLMSHLRGSKRSRLLLDQCVSALSVEELLEFVSLRRRTLRFVRPTLKIFMQNDDELVDVTIILLSNLLSTEIERRSDFET